MNIQEKINQLAHRVKMDTNFINSKMGGNSQRLNALVAISLADEVGFRVLDVPAAKDTIHRQYYIDNCQSIVDEILSGINEQILIDHKACSAAIFNVWHLRALLVCGRLPKNVTLEILEKSPTLSQDERKLVDDLADAYKEVAKEL